MKMIYRINSFWQKKHMLMFKVIYAISVIIFAAHSFKQGAKVEKAYSSRVYVEQNVSVHRFEMIDCEIIDDLTFKGNGDNARLIYNGEIDTLYMDCEFSYGLREFRAYYNTTGDYVFSEEDSMIPKQFDKYLMYDFPEGTKQVKMYYRNSTMYFKELLLNCRDHTNKYNISTSDLFLLAVVPAIVFLSIDLIISFANSIRKLFVKK